MERREQLVRAIGIVAQSWNEGDFSALAGVLHRDVVFRGPDGSQAIEGRETCLNSYVAFTDAAEITSFETGDAVIDLLGDDAVVLQPWRIRYRMNDRDHDEHGRDIYLFRHTEGRWQLCWRGAAAADASPLS